MLLIRILISYRKSKLTAVLRISSWYLFQVRDALGPYGAIWASEATATAALAAQGLTLINGTLRSILFFFTRLLTLTGDTVGLLYFFGVPDGLFLFSNWRYSGFVKLMIRAVKYWGICES